ncbi:MAG: glycine betaine ABC transporter substrate-binding protein [Litorivicinus sp.]
MHVKALLKTLTSAAVLSASLTASAAAIVVGGDGFTEQQLLSEMTTQLMVANGYDTEKVAGMGTAVLRKAQENGQVDLYWEYTGTSLINFNKIKEPMSMADGYAKVKELDAAKGMVWLNPSKANNTYALAMQRGESESKGIKTLSDLAAAVNEGQELTFAANAEFPARADGLKPLQKAYGFKFKRENIKGMDSGLTYSALKEGQVDIALVFATDGRIPAFDFVTLTDDKGYFPAYALTPVVRSEILDANPKLADLLNDLSGRLDDAVMSSLNAQVDVDKKTIENVATEFLTAQGLL